MSAPVILLPIRSNDDYDHLIISGIHLADRFKGKLSFLYVLESPEYRGYPPGNVAATATMQTAKVQKERAYEDYTAILDQFKGEITTDMSVEFNTTESTWSSGIVHYAKTNKPELILLHHEEKGFLEKILGETNTEIIRGVETPVWLVPEDKSVDKIDKIAFITHHAEDDLEVLGEIEGLCKQFDASLHILHRVVSGDFDSDIRKRGFNTLVREEISLKEIVHIDIEEERMNEEIDHIIEDTGISLLAIHHESEGFLKRFYARSSVEKLSDMVHIPIAIYK
jgi:nucleotide-binding universal stress UspA family protein